MEEHPREDHLTPEARRRDALLARIEMFTRPGSRALAVLRRVWTGAYNDGFIHAGNLAYMSLLALFPFFIVVAAIFSLIGKPAERDASVDAFLTALPPVVAQVLGPVAHDVVWARSGALLWIGAVVGLWTASSLLETIRDILHRAYGTQPTQAFWRYRLLSTATVFLSAIVMLVSLFAQVVIVAAEEIVAAWFPAFDTLFTGLSVSRLISAGVLYLAIYMLFATLTPSAYRRGDCAKWPGALLVTLWWVATTIGLPWALRLFFKYDLTYGSLAGVMIALFFFWLVGLGLVIGAELNAALAMSPEERHERERTGIGTRSNDGDADL